MRSSTFQSGNGRDTRPTVWHVGGEDVYRRIPLLQQLIGLGWRVGAVGSCDPDPFRAAQIPYWGYPLHRFVRPWADHRVRRELYRLFCAHRPDIVHGFDTKPAILATLEAHRAGIPGRVRTITGMGYVFASSSPLALVLRPVYRYLQQRASWAAGMTVFQNSEDMMYFRRHRLVPADRATLIPGSGVDVDALRALALPEGRCRELRRELGIGTQQFVVTMIARVVRHKGVMEYLQAARLVRRRGLDVAFLLVGPLESEGRQAISRLQIARFHDHVRYLGLREDVPSLLAASDVFVLPSYYREGIPRVLLEAGAMELPIITTDMPGCREVVQHGDNGLLVPPRDVNSLADAVDSILRQPASARATMGRAGQTRVKRQFSLPVIAQSYDALYRRVLGDELPSRARRAA